MLENLCSDTVQSKLSHFVGEVGKRSELPKVPIQSHQQAGFTTVVLQLGTTSSPVTRAAASLHIPFCIVQGDAVELNVLAISVLEPETWQTLVEVFGSSNIINLLLDCVDAPVDHCC